MRRLVLLLCVTLLVTVGVSIPRIVSVSASGQRESVAAPKKCKKGYHRVQGTCKKTKKPVAAPTLQTGMKVDVGGYKLYIRCTGTGSPTVILDGELGSGTLNSLQIVPGVASFTRVCAYDRAGVELSDSRTVHPGTSTMVVKELRTLLAAVHVDGPYVLAGPNFGGQNMQLFTYLYRSEVQGLVLIDGRVIDQCTLFLDWCPPLNEHEDVVLPESEVQLDSAIHGKLAGSLNDLPLVVLSDGRGFTGGGPNPLWDKLQAELATSSSNSIHVIATKSDRLILSTQPDLVIEAIHEVVTAARSSSPTLPPCGLAFEQLGGKCVNP